MFDQIKFTCKFCTREFKFQQRRTHLLHCTGVKVQGCPYGCQDVKTTMVEHNRKDCLKQPACAACDFKIYQKYHTVSLYNSGTQADGSRGHNCVRDNPQSDKLMISLRQL